MCNNFSSNRIENKILSYNYKSSILKQIYRQRLINKRNAVNTLGTSRLQYTPDILRGSRQYLPISTTEGDRRWSVKSKLLYKNQDGCYGCYRNYLQSLYLVAGSWTKITLKIFNTFVNNLNFIVKTPTSLFDLIMCIW